MSGDKEQMMILDRQNPQPLYVQFENIIRQKIENEEWPVNSSIPSENELSRMYGISRMTVHAVLNRIVDAGLLYRVQGKGTFIAEPKIESRPLAHEGIQAQLEEMGYETKTELLSIEKKNPAVKIRKILNLESEHPVYEIKRTRSVRGIPLSVHTSYVSVLRFPGLESQDLEKRQLCDIIEEVYKVPIVHRVETLEATTATSEEAQYLSFKTAAPLLLLENTAYTHSEIPIEYTKVVFRGDKIKLRLEYSKQD